MSLARLIAAKALFDGGHYRDCISRAYYAAYCAATARLTQRDTVFARGWNNPTHDQLPDLIRNFGGLSETERRRINAALRLLRSAREDADYRPGKTIDRSVALNCLRKADELLQRLEVKE